MSVKDNKQVTRITIKLNTKELELLTSLASDQLFRREFIDLRLPGYQSNAADLRIGKKLVERLRLMAGHARRIPSPARNGITLRRSRER